MLIMVGWEERNGLVSTKKQQKTFLLMVLADLRMNVYFNTFRNQPIIHEYEIKTTTLDYVKHMVYTFSIQ